MRLDGWGDLVRSTRRVEGRDRSGLGRESAEGTRPRQRQTLRQVLPLARSFALTRYIGTRSGAANLTSAASASVALPMALCSASTRWVYVATSAEVVAASQPR